MTKTDSYKPIGITHSASRTVLLALSHALLFLLALPPFSWWPLAFLALLPLVWLAQGARSSARAIVIVFVVQCGLWLWLGQWLIPVTMAGYPFFAMYLAIYATLFVWIIRRCLRTRIFARIPMTFLVPVIWIGLECLRGKVVFHGYGWYFIAHPLIEFPVYAQSADLLGSFFVGGSAAMISGRIPSPSRTAMVCFSDMNVFPCCTEPQSSQRTQRRTERNIRSLRISKSPDAEGTCIAPNCRGRALCLFTSYDG